jgi:hypothetical protein
LTNADPVDLPPENTISVVFLDNQIVEGWRRKYSAGTQGKLIGWLFFNEALYCDVEAGI